VGDKELIAEHTPLTHRISWRMGRPRIVLMVAKPSRDRSHRVLAAGLVILLAFASSVRDARAQAELNAEAMTVIDRALKRYRSLNTYQDRIEQELMSTARDPDGRDASSSERSTSSLAYAAPNRFLIEDDLIQLKFYRDQDRLWTTFRNIFTESKAKGPIDFAAAVPAILRPPLPEPTHPVLLALNQPDAGFADLFPDIRSVTAVENLDRQGAAGKLVKGTMELFKGMRIEQTVPFSAWFDDADGLLREVVIDVTEMMKDAVAHRPPEPGRPAVVERGNLIIRLDRIVTDAELPEDHFTFKPGSEDVRVSSITLESYQNALIGRPAPPFTGKDKDGKSFSLKENQGRVVVIDFWASWCRPCIALLPVMQEISEKFVDQPVTFIGVNNDDHPTGVAMARRFLTTKNITIPQVWDTDSAVSTLYRINGIPCTVIVDPNGVVQAIHLGFAPMELFTDVQTLLRGGSLLGKDGVAEQLGRAGE